MEETHLFQLFMSLLKAVSCFFRAALFLDVARLNLVQYDCSIMFIWCSLGRKDSAAVNMDQKGEERKLTGQGGRQPISAFSEKLSPWAETHAQTVTIQVMHYADHIIWYPLMVL